MQARQIKIFLNNKLIVCDTIVPLIVELKALSPDSAFEFITFDEHTYKAILQNTVLYDAITAAGTLTFRGRGRSTHPLCLIGHRIGGLCWLARLWWLALRGRLALIHFKELDRWPLRIIGLAAPHSTFLSQGSGVGVSASEQRASDLMFQRDLRAPAPTGHHLIYFGGDWLALSDGRATGRTVHRLPPPHSRAHWLHYVRRNADRYLTEPLEKLDVDKKSAIIPFVQTWLGPSELLREVDAFPRLLEQTLDVLHDECPNLPVFVKPHPATRPKEMAILQDILAKRAGRRIVLTHLHPMVLAQRARFAIGNAYSTTFAGFRFCEVPTVEFTDYAPRILTEMGGASMRPDLVTHFINKDAERLRKIVRQLLTDTTTRRAPAVSVDPLPTAFLSSLFGSSAHKLETATP